VPAFLPDVAPSLVPVPQPPLVTQTLPHSARTQQAGQKVTIADLLAQARVPLIGAQADLAKTRGSDITATQPARVANLKAGAAQKQAGTGLTKARTTTEGQRPALLQAQTAATKSIPGYRQGQLQLGKERVATTKRGQDITAATARRGQDVTAATAASNRVSHEAVSAANRAAKAGAVARLPEGSRPFATRLAALTTMQMRQASGATRFLTPAEIADQAAQINDQHQQAMGRPLFGPGGVLPAGGAGGGTSGGAAPAAAPSRPLSNPERAKLIIALKRRGLTQAEAEAKASGYR
jgi:hypothetical protein